MSKEKNIQHKMNFWVDKDLYLDFDAAVKNKEVASP